jgi:hypothetical protein
VGKSGFCALTGPLRQVRWPDKFKTGNIDRYDGSSNPEEFIQMYQIIIEAVAGDDQVKATVVVFVQAVTLTCHWKGYNDE